MHVEKFDYNDKEELLANTYVISDDYKKAVIIDPSSDGDGLSSYLIKNNLEPVAILLTHGHFDHIRGVNKLVDKYNLPIYIHENDREFLIDPFFNCSYMLKKQIRIEKEPILLNDKEELNLLSGDTIKVIHTPFHTVGSVCYYFINNKLLFSGDTLFMNSIGRDDLPTSNRRKRNSSLDKIKLLPKECKIYPGHGPNTSLNKELLLNHFLQL